MLMSGSSVSDSTMGELPVPVPGFSGPLGRLEGVASAGPRDREEVGARFGSSSSLSPRTIGGRSGSGGSTPTENTTGTKNPTENTTGTTKQSITKHFNPSNAEAT